MKPYLPSSGRPSARAWGYGLITAAAFAVSSAVVPAHGEGKPTASLTGTAPAAANRVVADIGIELIWIRPGKFVMGSPLEETGRNKAEGPQTTVTLTRGFWLGKTPVTQAHYQALIGSNPSHFTEVGPKGPVERVSWIDAMEFCEKLNARERAAGRLPEGYAYTLPTEAEWEYACRAGTTGTYPGNPEAMAWHKGNSGGTTHPVGEKMPNGWGLYDMSGNVLEWCLDWYGDYPGGAVTDPTGPARGYFRIARGGSWRVDIFRSASRSGGSSARRDYTLGFRLALAPVRPH